MCAVCDQSSAWCHCDHGAQLGSDNKAIKALAGGTRDGGSGVTLGLKELGVAKHGSVGGEGCSMNIRWEGREGSDSEAA